MRLVSWMAAAATAALMLSAPAASAADTPAAHFSVEKSTIGELLDDSDAKAVLAKDLPGITTNDQIDMARNMTLKDIQAYSPEIFTDKILAQINADLAKLPPKK